jgi:16S rRNA (cytidine1402-2'-O)-methyltransferase
MWRRARKKFADKARESEGMRSTFRTPLADPALRGMIPPWRDNAVSGLFTSASLSEALRRTVSRRAPGIHTPGVIRTTVRPRQLMLKISRQTGEKKRRRSHGNSAARSGDTDGHAKESEHSLRPQPRRPGRHARDAPYGGELTAPACYRIECDCQPMQTGTLYITATPIGNLEDITVRALRILSDVDYIAAEDTRKTGILLKHYTIRKRLISYFEHNEQSRTPGIIRDLLEGKSVALVSEAGTPTISDPGFRLVHAARQAGIPTIPVPGPNAAVAALSVSGLPVHRFAFEGFLPTRQGKRKNMLARLATESRTLIFYESPFRILAALQDMLEVLGDRPAMLARELTKLYEEHLCGSLASIREMLSRKKIKGEITLIVSGAAAGEHACVAIDPAHETCYKKAPGKKRRFSSDPASDD